MGAGLVLSWHQLRCMDPNIVCRFEPACFYGGSYAGGGIDGFVCPRIELGDVFRQGTRRAVARQCRVELFEFFGTAGWGEDVNRFAGGACLAAHVDAVGGDDESISMGEEIRIGIVAGAVPNDAWSIGGRIANLRQQPVGGAARGRDEEGGAEFGE